jgi:VCBS repeat-containing protein
VQHLSASETATDSFIVTSQDGTASQQVTITIQGANDPASISGTSSGSLGEDASAAATGALTVSDVDDGEAHTHAASGSGANGLGSYSIDADGHWSYTVNNALVQHLSASETATDSFIVTSQDGTASQQVTITIQGANDPASISGQDTGSVIEAGAGNNGGTPTAIGTLTISDPDTGQSAFQAETNVSTTYGHFTLNSIGAWSYTLDNTNPVVNALNNGQTLHDLINVSSVDGTTHTVNITINGATDDLGPPTGIAFNFATANLVNLEGSSSLNANQLIGSFIATGDPDSGDTFSYALSGANAGLFSLTSSGALSTGSTNVAGSSAGTIYSLTVTITDQAGNQFVATPIRVVVGDNGANTISLGSDAANIAFGLNGSDTITGTSGFDAISGGQSTDTITGGGSGDYLVGGLQSDTFIYTAVTDSQPGLSGSGAPKYDTIFGFTPASGSADVIDFTNISGLPTIDGAHTTAVQGSLTVGAQVLAHSVAWLQDTANNQTIVYVNASGSAENQGATDMEIHLVGIQALTASDFHHV